MTFTIAGKTVAKGFGLMGFTSTMRANPLPVGEAIAAMKVALDAGANFWNAGEFYGTPEYNSLHLLKAYFTKYPEDADRVVLSIKGGMTPSITPDGSEANIRRSVGYCYEMLRGVKSIDMFECARVDPTIPIEQTMGYLSELVKEGKIRGIGLSEVRAETIHRAAKVHPIAGVEVELSLWATEPLTNGVAAACAEHNIPLIAYSPLGHGFLTGQIRSLDDIPEGDFRKMQPRFQPDAFPNNLKLVELIEGVAKRKGCTPAQVGLAWVNALNAKPGMPPILPIPGAVAPARILENAHEVVLTDSELKEIDTFLEGFTTIGDRYPERLQEFSEG